MVRISVTLVGILLLACSYTTMARGVHHCVYKDPKQPIEKRIDDLLNQMTLAEKIGQMTQIERVNATLEVMKKFGIGSILSGGGSWPMVNTTASDWINMVNTMQKGALSTRLEIPMLYGIDAVHGHNNVYKATIFPHNIGLGATRQGQDHMHFPMIAFSHEF